MPKSVASTITSGALGLKGLLLPLATAFVVWGANGGFPKPPQIIQQLSRNELFQYFLVFIFVWQGGAQQNIQTALLATVILFLIAKFLDLRSLVTSFDTSRQAPVLTIVQPDPITMPPLTSAPPASGVPAGPMREGFSLPEQVNSFLARFKR